MARLVVPCASGRKTRPYPSVSKITTSLLMAHRNIIWQHKSAQKALENMAERLDVNIPSGFVKEYIASVENVTLSSLRCIMN